MPSLVPRCINNVVERTPLNKPRIPSLQNTIGRACFSASYISPSSSICTPGCSTAAPQTATRISHEAGVISKLACRRHLKSINQWLETSGTLLPWLQLIERYRLRVQVSACFLPLIPLRHSFAPNTQQQVSSHVLLVLFSLLFFLQLSSFCPYLVFCVSFFLLFVSFHLRFSFSTLRPVLYNI